MASLDLLPDLVYDSKIETEFLDSCWRHIFYDTGSSAKQRRIPREERWVRREFVGRGTYGSVYLEQCDIGSSRKLRAVKEIKKSITQGENLDYIRELEAVAKFSHQKYSHCFVQSHGWFELGDSIFISMEYLSNGDLQRHLHTPLKEPEARQITSQVLEGLKFMHDNGFVHRDLKPGNIMVVTPGPDWFVKITDFGVSKRRQHGMTSLHTQRGTIAFMAPEVFRSGGSYGSSVDMWSLGAVVYRIITNKLAFSDHDGLFQFSHGMKSFPVHEFAKNGVSSEAENFIIALMRKDPNERLSAAEAASHPWMAEIHQNIMTDDVSQLRAGNMTIPVPTHTGNASDSIASKDWSISSGGLSTSRQDTFDLPVVGVSTKMTTTTVSANEDTKVIDTDIPMKPVAFKSPRPLIYQKPSINDVPEEGTLRDSLPADTPFVLETIKTPESVAQPPAKSESRVNFETGKSRQAEFQNNDPPTGTFKSATNFNFQGGRIDISLRNGTIPTKESSEIDPSNSTDPAMTVVGDNINVKANNAIDQVSRSTAGENSNRETRWVISRQTCKMCGRKAGSTPDVVPCIHYWCDNCLRMHIGLSLMSPAYTIPQCCAKPWDETQMRQILRDSGDAFYAWRALVRVRTMARDKTWLCPSGHQPRKGSLQVTKKFPVVWRDPVECATCKECQTDPQLQNGKKVVRYSHYCLYCIRAHGSCNCRKWLDETIKEFTCRWEENDSPSGQTMAALQRALFTKGDVTARKSPEYMSFDDMLKCPISISAPDKNIKQGKNASSVPTNDASRRKHPGTSQQSKETQNSDSADEGLLNQHDTADRRSSPPRVAGASRIREAKTDYQLDLVRQYLETASGGRKQRKNASSVPTDDTSRRSDDTSRRKRPSTSQQDKETRNSDSADKGLSDQRDTAGRRRSPPRVVAASRVDENKHDHQYDFARTYLQTASGGQRKNTQRRKKD